MHKKLTFIQNICVMVAVLSIFVVMFLIGDTDVGAEAPSPWITATIACIAALASLIYAFIQFIGLPSLDEPSGNQGKNSKKK